MISGYVGHYYFLLNGEFIIDKCKLSESQSIDGVIARKLHHSPIDIHTDSYIFEGDVIFNMQTHQFEVTSYDALKRNYIFQNGVRNLFNIPKDKCTFIYDESL